MKNKLKGFLILATAATIFAMVLLPFSGKSQGSCYYIRFSCWFKPDDKCIWNGNDCGLKDPCGGGHEIE